ncbi:hypothetical protein RRG08_016343 [Elysia crispata]|uniref:Uncharacterized protein n=1 Tax=Elysia crispata TaxID=231223 RepID=A0AAE0YGS0_9GAST|nr:hypothetical protein RRG08_016343 [Elysia crispata]
MLAGEGGTRTAWHGGRREEGTARWRLNRLSSAPGSRPLMAFGTSQSVLASRNQTLGCPNEAGRAGLRVFVTSIRRRGLNPFQSPAPSNVLSPQPA